MNRDTFKREKVEIKGESPEGQDLTSVPDVDMDRGRRVTLQAFVPANPSAATNKPTASFSIDARNSLPSSVEKHALNSFGDMGRNFSASRTPSAPDTHGYAHASFMAVNDLLASSPADLDEVEDTNNRKRTIDYAESSDDEGGPIRGGREPNRRQKQYQNASNLTSKVKSLSSYIEIGHHSAEPLIPVFSKFKKSNTTNKIAFIYSRPMYETFPSGKEYKDYVPKNNIVGIEDVTLDADIFPASKDGPKVLSHDQKRHLIKQYLSSLIDEALVDGPAEDDMFASPTIPKLNQVPDIIVGFHIDDLELPVRAHLRPASRVCAPAISFKLDRADAKESRIEFHGLKTVLPHKIKYLPEFARPTEKETKVEIMTRFLTNENVNKDVEVSTVDDQPSSSRKKRANRRLTGHEGTPVITPRLSIELPNGTPDGIDESLESLQASGQAYLTTAFEYGQKLKARESAALEKEVSLMEREALVEDREQVIDKEVSTRADAAFHAERDVLKATEEKQTASQKRNEELERQLEQALSQLSNSSAQVTTSLPASNSSASSFLFLDLNGATFHQAYQKIPEESLNAGWFVKSQAEVKTLGDGPLRGKKFTQNQILQPIQGIAVPGRLKDIAVRCDGVEYLHYEENGISKLVQNSESVVQHEGQYYVRWTYLREMTETFTF